MITSFILRSSNPTTENYPTLPDPTVLAHAGSCSGREIARTRGDRPKIAQASKSIPAPSHTFLRTSPRLRAHTPIPSTAQIGATPDLTLALPHSATASPSNSSPSLHARGSSPIPYRRHRRSPSQPSASRLPLIPDRQFVVAHNVKRSKFTSKELLQNPCIASRTPRRWCRCHGDGGLPHGPEIQRSDMSIFRSAMSIIHMSESLQRQTSGADVRSSCWPPQPLFALAAGGFPLFGFFPLLLHIATWCC
uniref:Uncharacterized protein n=1 Tax=Oryza punctata TaxID=4537 RepID=A0A0E0LT66_ORYPU